ncbi:hypothetical protein PybrP1_007531 [[Pythium] brassicae (nom. inval.)]|nr:hypothetical protein PybrP1_007531 [[Pythium] brassicae (nom. inval.)]
MLTLLLRHLAFVLLLLLVLATATAPPGVCPNVSRTAAAEQHVLFASVAIKGHALPLLRVAGAMQARGFRVSFATHESGKEWAAAHGVPFLSAGAFPVSADDLRAKLKAMTRDASTFRGILTMVSDIYVAAARPMYDALLPQLRECPPDLIVLDVATLGAQDLAHKLGVPYVVNSPSVLFDLGSTPSYVPAWGTGYSVHMSLWQRCMNLLFPRLLSVALTPPFMQLNKVRWELELPPYRSQHDVFKGARVLLNTAFGLEHAQPLSPLVHAVGPILPLPEQANASRRHHAGSSLRSWLDAAPSGDSSSSSGGGGVVYLNLGTLAYIDAWQAQALLDGLLARLDEPPVRVLWVLPTDQRSVLPADLPPTLKVKSPSGVSSADVLAHPSVRLAVSHCGMVSAQEALVHRTPLLCIPFLVDQPDVAARVVDAGAGLALDKNALTAASVHRAAAALLANASYAQNAARVGRLLELAGGTSRAVEVIESALRLGSRHLETLDLELPWHKTALLDVWTVYAALFCLLAFAVRIHWLLLYFVVSEALAFAGGVLFGPPPPQGAASSLAESSQPEGSKDGGENGQDATESESSEVLAND